eukprot:TRINITY_DN10521_c0_g2_i1.p1 TRINITY_DN10521_c0_g2~~TRINITY_DN10521_c0_g2_i1.p1  ORF type:complete len:215 (+),score=27.53 TRINITY_DN10521_c0_g2_i1:298-942(+)
MLHGTVSAVAQAASDGISKAAAEAKNLQEGPAKVNTNHQEQGEAVTRVKDKLLRRFGTIDAALMPFRSKTRPSIVNLSNASSDASSGTSSNRVDLGDVQKTLIEVGVSSDDASTFIQALSANSGESEAAVSSCTTFKDLVALLVSNTSKRQSQVSSTRRSMMRRSIVNENSAGNKTISLGSVYGISNREARGSLFGSTSAHKSKVDDSELEVVG